VCILPVCAPSDHVTLSSLALDKLPEFFSGLEKFVLGAFGRVSRKADLLQAVHLTPQKLKVPFVGRIDAVQSLNHRFAP
jgi:hypothetical protein